MPQVPPLSTLGNKADEVPQNRASSLCFTCVQVTSPLKFISSASLCNCVCVYLGYITSCIVLVLHQYERL